VIRQAEGHAPKIGPAVEVAPASLQPMSVANEVFTGRGDGCLAVFQSAQEMYGTPFDAQGARETAGSIDLGPCDTLSPSDRRWPRRVHRAVTASSLASR
jgi:hypothetical protein